MRPFDSIVFDLDGTLWDTTSSCVIAWNSCIEKLGIDFRPIVDGDVRAVTGKAHDECIRLTFSDLDEMQIQNLIEITATEDIEVISRLGGQIYPGVAEGLVKLNSKFKLYIVSNCQAGYIESFLAYSRFAQLFKDFECFGNTGKHKGYNLARLIDRNSLKNSVYVGDAEGDEVAARECGVPFFYVSYGFGKAVAPDKCFESFRDLVDFFMAK